MLLFKHKKPQLPAAAFSSLWLGWVSFFIGAVVTAAWTSPVEGPAFLTFHIGDNLVTGLTHNGFHVNIPL